MRARRRPAAVRRRAVELRGGRSIDELAAKLEASLAAIAGASGASVEKFLREVRRRRR